LREAGKVLSTTPIASTSDGDGDATKMMTHEGDQKSAGGRLSKEEYERRWLEGLSVEVVPLDLASIESVLACSDQVKKR
jgi:hypothetical protein